MENENDHRAITIHRYLWGPGDDEELLINDTKISIYYLPKNSYKSIYDSNDFITEDGYIIEAQVKIARHSKIEFITKEYFDEIYKEFENINLKALEKEASWGSGGSQLEIKMGMLKYNNAGSLFDPLVYIGKTRNISLWSPYEDNKKPEILKLLHLIKSIETKIEFDKWWEYNYEELKKCYNSHWLRMFRIDIKKEIEVDVREW